MKQRWMEKENEILRRLYALGAKEELLDALPGRSWEAILHQAACVLHLERAAKARWGAAELARLRQMYPTATKRAIIEAFPGRSWETIGRVAALNHIRRAAPWREDVWTEQEKSLLREMYASTEIADLLRRLPGRSRASITKQVRVLGLKRQWTERTSAVSPRQHHKDMIKKYCGGRHEQQGDKDCTPYLKAIRDWAISIVRRSELGA